MSSDKHVDLSILAVAFDPDCQPERKDSFGQPFLKFPVKFADTWWLREKGIVVDAAPLSAAWVKKAKANLKAYCAMLAKYEGDIPLYVRTKEDGTVETVTAKGTEVSAWIVENVVPRYNPTRMGVTGNRRGSCVFVSGYAKHRLLTDNGKKFDLSALTIPCVERTYLAGKAGERQRQADRWRENEEADRAPYSFGGLVSITTSLLTSHGAKRSDVMLACGVLDGVAQKLIATSQLHTRYPTLRLVDRLQMDPPTDSKGKRVTPVPYKAGGYLPSGPLSKEAMRTLVGGQKIRKPDAVAVKAMGGKAAYTEGQIATEEQVERYLQLAIEGKSNAPKTMSGGDIDDAIGGMQDNPVRQAAQAVRANDNAKLVAAENASRRLAVEHASMLAFLTAGGYRVVTTEDEGQLVATVQEATEAKPKPKAKAKAKAKAKTAGKHN